MFFFSFGLFEFEMFLNLIILVSFCDLVKAFDGGANAI